jgi:hypothetical protein
VRKVREEEAKKKEEETFARYEEKHKEVRIQVS